MKGNLVLNAASTFRGDVVLHPKSKRAYHKFDNQDDINVCLTCQKKRCCGEDKCFRQRRKELRGEAVG